MRRTRSRRGRAALAGVQIFFTCVMHRSENKLGQVITSPIPAAVAIHQRKASALLRHRERSEAISA